MDIQVVRSEDLSPAARARIRELLQAAFDGDFSDDDWAHTLGGTHVVAAAGSGRVAAHAAVVERAIEVGDRPLRAGYVEGVATAPDLQDRGIGSVVMARVGDVLHAGFELGVLSTGRHRFYERLGWERWRGPAYVRRGREVVRTPDEDDGVMVLRYGATAGLDRTQPISCEARPGDDW